MPEIKCGDLVRDRITRFEGIATAVATFLNGCVRVSVQPPKMHDGKPVEDQTFDVQQLEVVRAGEFFAKSGAKREPVGKTGGPRKFPTRARDCKR